MCLYNIGRKKTAKEDMKVYKYLQTRDGCEYHTPFRGVTVQFGVVFTSKLHRTVEWGGDYPVITVALHSYKTRYSADKEAKVGHVLVECKIPKGSKYYEGKFDSKKGYASDTLIYVKIIKDYRQIMLNKTKNQSK